MKLLVLKDVYPFCGEAEVLEIDDELYALMMQLALDWKNLRRKDKRYHEKTPYKDGITEWHSARRFYDITETVIRRLAAERVRDALENALTPVQRERVFAFFYEGLSYTEIARREGVSKQKIHKSVMAALKKLKLCLDEG